MKLPGLGKLAGAALALWCLSTPAVLADVTVIDYTGRAVTMTEPASRIVTLSPHITELLFEIGAGDRIIAASEFSNYPEAARALDTIGGYNSFNLEKLVTLAPDLVIAWGAGNSERDIARLQAMGYAVYVDDPRSLGDIPRTLRDLARLAGEDAAGEEAAQRFSAGLEAIAATLPGRAYRPSVFYEIWHDPLQTLNGEHLVSEIIGFCGGDNVFAGERVLAPVVNIESVILADPDIIVASGDSESPPAWLAAWQQFPDMRAVRNGRIYSIPPDHLQRHTSRVLLGVRRMCEILGGL